MENVLHLPSSGTASVTQSVRMLAAGPLTKQPMTMPYRIVLLEHRKPGTSPFYNDSSFSVHSEIFKSETLIEDEQNGRVTDWESYLHQGDYFKPGQFAEAVKRFGERVANDSIHVASCYNRRDAS